MYRYSCFIGNDAKIVPYRAHGVRFLNQIQLATTSCHVDDASCIMAMCTCAIITSAAILLLLRYYRFLEFGSQDSTASIDIAIKRYYRSIAPTLYACTPQLMPHVFYWIQIQGFSWCLPPIHPLLFKELSGCFGSVLVIIVSHKAMANRRPLVSLPQSSMDGQSLSFFQCIPPLCTSPKTLQCQHN